MKHQIVIEIDGPAVAVAKPLLDVRGWPDWLPTVDGVTPLAPDEPDGPGARYEVRQPRMTKAVWQITQWEPGAGFAWESSSPGVRSVGTHHVEDLGERSRVTLGVEWQGPLAPLVNLVYGRLTQRYIATEAASLKALVEAGA